MNDHDFFTSLFQQQKQLAQNEHQKEIPSFEQLYGKAQQQYTMTRITKWSVAIFLLLSLAIAGISFAQHDTSEQIPIAKATTSLYKTLMDEGKIVRNDIYFEYDKAMITAPSIPVIQAIADVMKAHKEVRLRIEGHTDSSGSSSYNQKLSTLRAAAVKQKLLQMGIAESRLESKGFGESQPVAKNDSGENRSKNRRVEFVLLD